MRLKDYHVHSSFSWDCRQSIEALAGAALQAGLDEVCITDHIEFGHPDPGENVPPDMQARSRALQAASGKFPSLKIRAGIEIGDNAARRGDIQAWLRQYPLDFRLLSLHLIHGVDPYLPPNVDRPDYYEGLMRAEAYHRYAECALESVMSWPAADYDAVAHLGYVAKFAPYDAAERPFQYKDAPDMLRSLLKHLADNGKALEINTSIYDDTGDFMASRSTLQEFRSLGGELVTLGSDAHRPQNVGHELKAAHDIAVSCGFCYAAAFHERKLMPYKLD